MRILFLSPNYRKRVNWGHQLFRDEIMRQYPFSMQYGEGCKYNGETDLRKIFKQVGYYDVVVMENQKNMQKYSHLADVDCLKVMYLGDYLPDGRGNIQQYNKLINKHEIDLAFCPVPKVYNLFEREKRRGNVRKECCSRILPYSVDTKIYKPRPHLEKIYDVMAVFGLVSYIYPNRPNVQHLVKSMPVRSLIGDWGSKLRWYDYARAISQSKIFVSVNGIHNQITMKYTEAMASGALLLTNKPEDFMWFGFVPNYHCIVWSTLTELKHRIIYYLENEESRLEIANRGMRFTRRYYSTKVKAKEFIKEITDATNRTSNGSLSRYAGRNIIGNWADKPVASTPG